MIANKMRQAWKLKRKSRDQSREQTWKRVDQAPIPLTTGRIWLVDNDGNIRRAIAWTWPVLKRREPDKYRWWMNRIDRAREPTPEAIAALAALKQATMDRA
jgi:hypothetical protein